MIESIWSQFKDELLNFIDSKVKDKELSQDLLQDVFVKIHLKLSTISEKEKLTSWVYQITRNTIIDYFRKNNKSELKEISEFENFDDNSNYNDELLCCLKPLIEDLPEKYSDAILETTYGSLSQKEYAENIGLSYSATKSRIQRARKMLKETFINCCVSEADKYGNIIDLNQDNCDCD